MRSRAGPHRDLGERIDNPKTGRPIGSGPFLVERWERGKQLTLVRNPRYWGPHAAYLDRIVIRFCKDACNAHPGRGARRLASGRGRFRVRRATRRIVSGPPANPGLDGPCRPSTRLGHLHIGGPEATPRFRTSSSVGRWPTGSTGSRSSAAVFGEIDPTSPARQRRLPESATATTGRTGAAIATGRLGPPPARAGRLPARTPTASTPARASGSRFAS